MKLEGYFLAIVRNQVFDPEVGAESLGSLQAIPSTREDIVWNVTISQIRQDESVLTMQAGDGGILEYRVLPGRPMALLASEDENGTEIFAWHENPDFESGGSFQTQDLGGIELVKLDPIFHKSGYRMAGVTEDNDGALPSVDSYALGPNLLSHTLIVDDVATLSVSGVLHLLIRTTSGEVLKFITDSPHPWERTLTTFWDEHEEAWEELELLEPRKDHSTDRDAIFFRIDGGGLVELGPRNRINLDEILGFSLPEGSSGWLAERLLLHMSSQPIRAFGLPLPPGFVRSEAIFCPSRKTGLPQCIGIEIWAQHEGEPLADANREILLARRERGRWVREESQEVLDACVEWGVNEPYAIEGFTRQEIDPARAGALVRLYDLVPGLSLAAVAIFSDPPGRTLSFAELPVELQPIFEQLLKKFDAGDYEDPELWVTEVLDREDESPTSLMLANKVVQGFVEAGLRARLDSLASSLSSFLGSISFEPKNGAEESWNLVEHAISDALAALPDESLSVDAFAYRDSGQAGKEGEELATLRFWLRPDSVEIEIELDWYPDMKGKGHIQIDEYYLSLSQNEAFYDQMAQTIDLELLERHWEFDQVDIDRFVRTFDGALNPAVAARMITSLLQGDVTLAAPITTDFLDIFVQGDDDPETSQTFRVWAHGPLTPRIRES
jgi:hypothetical protein